MDIINDEFAGEGGCYEVRDGKRVRVQESTKDHPEGNRPRDADGKPLAHVPSAQAEESPRPATSPATNVKPLGSRRPPQPE